MKNKKNNKHISLTTKQISQRMAIEIILVQNRLPRYVQVTLVDTLIFLTRAVNVCQCIEMESLINTIHNSPNHDMVYYIILLYRKSLVLKKS